VRLSYSLQTKWWLAVSDENTEKADGDRVVVPPFIMTGDDAYIFVGLANINGSEPPTLLPDPAIKYGSIEITSILMARFKTGPLGPVDVVSPLSPLFRVFSIFLPPGALFE
jgi:hypothetical protein